MPDKIFGSPLKNPEVIDEMSSFQFSFFWHVLRRSLVKMDGLPRIVPLLNRQLPVSSLGPHVYVARVQDLDCTTPPEFQEDVAVFGSFLLGLKSMNNEH